MIRIASLKGVDCKPGFFWKGGVAKAREEDRSERKITEMREEKIS
jgi:hypothetical protein